MNMRKMPQNGGAVGESFVSFTNFDILSLELLDGHDALDQVS